MRGWDTKIPRKVLTCAKIRNTYMTHCLNLIKQGYVTPGVEVSRISCGSPILQASSLGNKNDYGQAINNWDNGGWED